MPKFIFIFLMACTTHLNIGNAKNIEIYSNSYDKALWLNQSILKKMPSLQNDYFIPLLMDSSLKKYSENPQDRFKSNSESDIVIFIELDSISSQIIVPHIRIDSKYNVIQYFGDKALCPKGLEKPKFCQDASLQTLILKFYTELVDKGIGEDAKSRDYDLNIKPFNY